MMDLLKHVSSSTGKLVNSKESNELTTKDCVSLIEKRMTMTRTEWIRMEEEIEARIEDLEDRCSYINKVWRKLYGGLPKQRESIDRMAEQFKELQTTDTEKYLDALEDFVKYMEESSLYVEPKQTTAKE
tara:strand:+ start:355 stop:741 length:387 start_codon:yes stop_codon:yes gene_type:complete